MDITAEEVGSRVSGGRKGIGSSSGPGDDVTFKDGGITRGISIDREVMGDATIHIIEVNCYLRAGRNRNSTHVKGQVLGGQVDGGRSSCGTRAGTG